MAVAFRNGTSNNNASTASTTIRFLTPATPTAGDIWICTANFRGGSTVTISGVPAGFHLIQRVDSGSATTANTLVSYWYQALGSESGTFATITISASSKYTTITDAFSGVNQTVPVPAASISSTSSSGINIVSNWPNFTPGQLGYAVGGMQGGTGASLSDGAGLNTTEGPNTTGGSGATNVLQQGGWDTTAADSGATLDWNITGGATDTFLTFTIDQVPAGGGIQARSPLWL